MSGPRCLIRLSLVWHRTGETSGKMIRVPRAEDLMLPVRRVEMDTDDLDVCA
jgi:hypothetical protein